MDFKKFSDSEMPILNEEEFGKNELIKLLTEILEELKTVNQNLKTLQGLVV